MMIVMFHDWNSFFKYFLIYVLCAKIYALLFLILSIDDVSILSFPAKPTTLHAQDRSIGPFPFPLDNPTLIEYSFSDRTRETLVKSQSLMQCFPCEIRPCSMDIPKGV